MSLTCWIFGEIEDLPTKRSQLYQRGIKLLSHVANRKFNQEQYALFEESEIQTYIAEYLKDISTNESLEVVKAIEAQHGLLIKRAQGFDSAEADYLYANKLILDCKKAAIGETSPDYWQEIETRMLKPNLSRGSDPRLLEEVGDLWVCDLFRISMCICYCRCEAISAS
ncbi:NACHT C-terminal helical domain 2-containing protein [Nodularia sp. UHCC 0506]|uniref:NACHT C-terminal helical domain 2-containing protein n=1 Tax=Nodularia sp. UHCC 0506 TaxID=3110243 RepID=UPI002B21CD7C|nr:hypothetical protein [Nodularia sp. UHCC 0506]MEA5515135.1 hypothetical protein [Nodularia sp. UHCC 0506]